MKSKKKVSNHELCENFYPDKNIYSDNLRK